MVYSISSNRITTRVWPFLLCTTVLLCHCYLTSSSSSSLPSSSSAAAAADEKHPGNDDNNCLDIEDGQARSSSSSLCRQDQTFSLDEASSSSLRVPDSCELVLMLETPEQQRHHQWAVYTMVSRKKGTPVRKFGDIVIQWTDPLHRHRATTQQRYMGGMNHDNDDDDKEGNPVLPLLKDFTWNGQETGGQYEGHHYVESVVPGLPMLSRTTNTNTTNGHIPNILPLIPRVDEGGLTRLESPGAGSITHYHNYTWWYLQDVEPGDELVYSDKGKKTMHPFNDDDTITGGDRTLQRTTVASADSTTPLKRPSINDLKTNGYCIDNMIPRKSRIQGAGRGAFASRTLLEGSIVAPIPVAMVPRSDLVDNDTNNNKWQLLLNYCFGHKESSWLFFPYSPTVNLINHYHEPNVKLQWSSKTTTNEALLENNKNITTTKIGSSNSTTTTTQQQHHQASLLMELVATKTIHEGEEIYMDYGKEWEDAWWNHIKTIWKPIYQQHYTPSYVMDDAIRLVRTEEEQKTHPYPNNLFTTCFYRYSDRTDEDRELAKLTNIHASSKFTSYRWHLTKGLYDIKNLRPCQILKRLDDTKSGRSAYAVRMLNRPNVQSMDSNEIIPSNEVHIVTHVPRAAIRFSDKAGTTDVHLPNAFRHEIGLPDDLLLPMWRDLDNVVATGR